MSNKTVFYPMKTQNVSPELLEAYEEVCLAAEWARFDGKFYKTREEAIAKAMHKLREIKEKLHE